MTSFFNFIQWMYTEITSYNGFTDRIITAGVIIGAVIVTLLILASAYTIIVDPILDALMKIVRIYVSANNSNKTDKKEEK